MVFKVFGFVPAQGVWIIRSKLLAPFIGTQDVPMKIRIVTMSEFHKTAPLSRFMKLRGDSRANKPIYGLFSRHYYIKLACGKQRYNYKKETTFPHSFPHSLTKGARRGQAPALRLFRRRPAAQAKENIPWMPFKRACWSR